MNLPQRVQKQPIEVKPVELPKFRFTEVFVWGSDANGQLGLKLHNETPTEKSYVRFYQKPRSCSFNVLIKQIECGNQHTAMLTRTGHLYMMGQNNFGQLGVGGHDDLKQNDLSRSIFDGSLSDSTVKMQIKANNVRAPCLVEALKFITIVKVGCGANFTVALAANDNKSQIHQSGLYAWGDNQFDQLGLMTNNCRTERQVDGSSITSRQQNKLVLEPKQVPEVDEALQLTDFRCGENHLIVKAQTFESLVTETFQPKDVHYYSCGLNSFGQCGHPVMQSSMQSDHAKVIKQLARIRFPMPLANGISDFSAGVNHSLFLSSSNHAVYQCGGVSNSSLFSPVLITEPIKHIQCSQHSVALSKSGVMYIWSSHDQFNPSYLIRNVKQVSLSKRFAVIVGEKDKTYIWGSIQPGFDSIDQPFFTQYTPSEEFTRNLKGKTIIGISTGEDFVMAVGRDMKTHKKAKQTTIVQQSHANSKQVTQQLDLPKQSAKNQEQSQDFIQQAVKQRPKSVPKCSHQTIITVDMRGQLDPITMNPSAHASNVNVQITSRPQQTQPKPRDLMPSAPMRHVIQKGSVRSNSVTRLASDSGFAINKKQTKQKGKGNKCLNNSSSVGKVTTQSSTFTSRVLQPINSTNPGYQQLKQTMINDETQNNPRLQKEKQSEYMNRTHLTSSPKLIISSVRMSKQPKPNESKPIYQKKGILLSKQPFQRQRTSTTQLKQTARSSSVSNQMRFKSNRDLKELSRNTFSSDLRQNSSCSRKKRSTNKSISSQKRRSFSERTSQKRIKRSQTDSQPPDQIQLNNQTFAEQIEFQRGFEVHEQNIQPNLPPISPANNCINLKVPINQNDQMLVQDQSEPKFVNTLVSFLNSNAQGSRQQTGQNSFSLNETQLNLKQDPDVNRLLITIDQQRQEITQLLDRNRQRDLEILHLRQHISQCLSSSATDHLHIEGLKIELQQKTQEILKLKTIKFQESKSKCEEITDTYKTHNLKASQVSLLKGFDTKKNSEDHSMPTFRSEDLFVANEQICKMQSIMHQQQDELRIKQQQIEQAHTDLREMELQLTMQQKQTVSVQEQLALAEAEMEDLQQGVKDFQEQAQTMQNELIKQLHDLQQRYVEQKEQYFQLHYEFEVLKKKFHHDRITHMNENHPELKEMDRLRKDLVRKDNKVAELTRENKELKEKLTSMMNQVEKQSFNDLLSKVGVSKSRERDHSQKEIEAEEKAAALSTRRGRSPPKQEPVVTEVKKETEEKFDMTMTSKFSKRSMERVFPIRSEKYVHSNIKDLISEKYEERRQETLSKSRERSVDRHQLTHQSQYDKDLLKTNSKESKSFYQRIEEQANKTGNVNQHLPSKPHDKFFNNLDTIHQMNHPSPKQPNRLKYDLQSFDNRLNSQSQFSKDESRNMTTYRLRGSLNHHLLSENEPQIQAIITKQTTDGADSHALSSIEVQKKRFKEQGRADASKQQRRYPHMQLDQIYQ